MNEGTLHFFCGKMAAGKSTLSRSVADENNAILLSEDHWLGTLYPDEVREFADYLEYSSRIRDLLEGHITELLRAGVSVVLDFPGNTGNQRKWFRTLFEKSGVEHRLHYVKATDEQCLGQLRERSKDLPEGAPFTSEAEFHAITKYFEPPDEAEGFDVLLHGRGSACV
jgi:predicted kinase